MVCAFGALIKEPLLSALRDPERAPVAASALARRGADRAGDHGRRRADGRVDHAAHSGPRQRAGVPATAGEPIGRAGHVRLARRAPGAARRESCWCGRSTAEPRGAADASSSRTRAATYAEKIAAGDRLLDPARPAVELERDGARPAPAHRRARGLADGRDVARRALSGVLAEALQRARRRGRSRPRRAPCVGTRDGALELLVRAAARRAPDGRRLPTCAATARRAGRRDGRLRWRAGRRAANCPARGPARCAYAVLRRVFEQGAYADLRAARRGARARRARPGARDAPRLRRGAAPGTLDHLIERLAGRPVGRLDAPRAGGAAAGALRAAATCGGAPDHAVVADAVELAKRTGRGGPRPCQRGAAPRHARGRGAARGARRRHPGGRGGQALASAVDRASCGGRSWAPRRRARCWRPTTSRASWRCA